MLVQRLSSSLICRLQLKRTSRIPQHLLARTMSDSALSTTETGSAITTSAQPLVMQIIFDRQLLDNPSWPLGPLLTQASHATAAIIARTISSSRQTQEYTSAENLPVMHTVALQTRSKGPLSDLTKLSEELARVKKTYEGDEFPDHHLWIEQPENIPTCIAIAPNSKPPVRAPKKVEILPAGRFADAFEESHCRRSRRFSISVPF